MGRAGCQQSNSRRDCLCSFLLIFLYAATVDTLALLIPQFLLGAAVEALESAFLLLFLFVRITYWAVVGCVAVPMGIMVLKREDGRHAFDILAGVIVVRNPTTARHPSDSQSGGNRSGRMLGQGG